MIDIAESIRTVNTEHIFRSPAMGVCKGTKANRLRRRHRQNVRSSLNYKTGVGQHLMLDIQSLLYIPPKEPAECRVGHHD